MSQLTVDAGSGMDLSLANGRIILTRHGIGPSRVMEHEQDQIFP